MLLVDAGRKRVSDDVTGNQQKKPVGVCKKSKRSGVDSRYSKRRLTIGQFAQPVKTPYEAKLFIELYFRHTQRKNGRTGKVNWSVMTAEWNAHVLQCLKQSNGVDATLKHQCHLNKYAANTVELFDQSHSSALQMAQRQLAQASLRSFLPPTVVPSGQENPVPQAPLVISAPPEIPAGTDYGGKGGGKKCRLCFVIENKRVLGKDGHLESCKTWLNNTTILITTWCKLSLIHI